MTLLASPIADAGGSLEPLRLLESLNDILASLQTKVEFYFVGGAVMFQALSSHPRTAQVSDMFRSPEIVRDALLQIAARESTSTDWLPKSVRSLLTLEADGPAFVELSHVSVFAPPPEYVLALKCAAMRLGEDAGQMDDLRYLLRAMNMTSAEEALSIVGRYFTARQLAPQTGEMLAKILGA